MRILIIEDDFVIANALRKELEKYEYEVELVEDFSDVMSAFQSFAPHFQTDMS